MESQFHSKKKKSSTQLVVLNFCSQPTTACLNASFFFEGATKARICYSWGWKKRKRELGLENLDTLVSGNNLAPSYRKQGRWKNGDQLQLHVMESRKHFLGPEHPIRSVYQGGFRLCILGPHWDERQNKKAEELQVYVMESRRRLLG